MEEPDFWSSLSMRLTASVARRVQRPDAEDVVQGALMSVWARQAEGDVEDVAAYATRTVERELLNFWRGHRRRAWSWSDGVDVHDVAADEPEDDWLGTADGRAWLAEVLSLPPHEHGLSSCQVQILSLLLGGSHTIASIARHLGCERHRVRSQLRSAAVKLRNLRESWSPPGVYGDGAARAVPAMGHQGAEASRG